jgi:putative toxin-antitoxin system antitoxin component (TIGR02293 family)
MYHLIDPGGFMPAKLRSSPRAKRVRPKAGKAQSSASDSLWDLVLQRKRPLGSLYALAPMGRVDLVKRGVPPAALGLLAADMGITREQLYATLGVPRATMERKMRQGRRLNQDESERVVGIARLVGQVEHMVRESGDPEGFDAPRWVAAWLERPLPALGGARPRTLMDTAEGRDIVSSLVAQMQSGTYA